VREGEVIGKVGNFFKRDARPRITCTSTCRFRPDTAGYSSILT
jgi:hypothetical protein